MQWFKGKEEVEIEKIPLISLERTAEVFSDISGEECSTGSLEFACASCIQLFILLL